MYITYKHIIVNVFIKIKNRVKEKNLGIIVYDEIEDGRYKFKDKSYDVILELEGESI